MARTQARCWPHPHRRLFCRGDSRARCARVARGVEAVDTVAVSTCTPPFCLQHRNRARIRLILCEKQRTCSNVEENINFMHLQAQCAVFRLLLYFRSDPGRRLFLYVNNMTYFLQCLLSSFSFAETVPNEQVIRIQYKVKDIQFFLITRRPGLHGYLGEQHTYLIFLLPVCLQIAIQNLETEYRERNIVGSQKSNTYFHRLALHHTFDTKRRYLLTYQSGE